MRKKWDKLKEKITNNMLFLRNFLLLFLSMTFIFSIFTVYTYWNSRKIIETEFTNSGVQNLQNIAVNIDNYMMDIRYIISTLVVNDTLQFFYASPNPEAIWKGYYGRVKEQLDILQFSQESIQAIYLYSEISGMIYSGSTSAPVEFFSDRYWLEQLDPDEHGFSIFPYAIQNMFPYCICVAKEFTVNNSTAIVAIMVDLSKVPLMKSIGQNSYQNAYLISDDGDIIYRYRQDDLREPLETVEELTLYQPDTTETVMIQSHPSQTYSIAQLSSSEYPWTYVLVTNLQNYTSRLSASNALLFSLSFALLAFAILFALFFTFRSTRPIRDIRNFLEYPEFLSADKIHDSVDVKFIARRITQYIQLSNELSDELSSRMHMLHDTQIRALQSQINPHFLFNTLNLMYIQATDALGYDHKLPQTIVNTSSLIRYAIHADKMVVLETELSHNNEYLSILEQRYDQNLKIIQEIDPDTMKAKVPRLLIQPFVENAIFHGFSKRIDGNCILSIRILRKHIPEDNDMIVLQIQDNGNGMSTETLSELRLSLNQDALTSDKNIGLRNVVQRMNLIYADKFNLAIESVSGEGTLFTLQFPYIE